MNLTDGHAIVAGAGGSGRRSLGALAAYAAGCIVVQPAVEVDSESSQDSAAAVALGSTWDAAFVRAIRLACLANQRVAIIAADSDLPEGQAGKRILQQLARLLTADPLSMLPRDVRASMVAEASAEIPRLRAALSSQGSPMHLAEDGMDGSRANHDRGSVQSDDSSPDGIGTDGMSDSDYSEGESQGATKALSTPEGLTGEAEELLCSRIRANLHLIFCASVRSAAGSISISELAVGFPGIIRMS